MAEVSLRPATGVDATEVAALVSAAYRHYVERIGMLPRPMTEDYAEVIRDRQVTVAISEGTIVGVIVLDENYEGFLIDNVAVHPSFRGKGIGRTLLEFAEAEARRAGYDSIYLYTHEGMTENIALYSRIGYTEYDRRSQGDFSLVYMRKQLEKKSGGQMFPPKPTGYSSVSPYLMVTDAQRVIDFLKQVFGATELRRFPMPDGSVMHAEVKIDDTVIMLADAGEEIPAFPVWLHVYVPDVDETYRCALEAGAEPVQEPQLKEGDTDRRGGVKDPSGNTWWIATQVREAI